MDAHTLHPKQLFQKDIRYEIPQFQRPYVWEQEMQWEPLWEDVRDAAEEYLDGDSRSHFMGAVVLQQRASPTSGIETRIVVDGQQRLTTIQLLLDAVQEAFKQREYGLEARRLSLMVLNNQVYWENDSDLAFKIWPTVFDREAFRHAMQDDLPSAEYAESRIVQAHDFFKDQVGLWLDDFPEQSKSRVAALEYAVGQLLELVVIDLETKDDPHVIFETLNARGTPLIQSDLVKNLVLYQAGVGVDGDSEEASNLWRFDSNWWREEITQGRLRHPRVDVFLNYWTVVRKQSEIAVSDVFSVFRDYAENANRSIQEIANDIGCVGDVYRNLEEGGYPEYATFLYRRQVMQVGVLTPVLLWLFSSGVPSPQIAKSLRAIESYLVRRMICRITTKDYNQLFVGLLRNLELRGVEHAGNTVVEYLAAQDAHVRQWPGDWMIEEAFMTVPLYRLLTRGRLRLILEGIEAELRTNWAESQSVPHNLTIEHVMPQGWRTNWPLLADTEDHSRASGNRDRLVHSMGNLTLITGRLNASLSNSSWQQKRQTLERFSTLYLNKTLLDNAPGIWDEAAIAERAHMLCQAAIKMWPHADGIR